MCLIKGANNAFSHGVLCCHYGVTPLEGRNTQAIIMLIIPIMFSTLGGMVAAVGVSAFATPIVGVPVGIVVFLMLMGKFLSRGNLNPILRTGMSHE